MTRRRMIGTIAVTAALLSLGLPAIRDLLRGALSVRSAQLPLSFPHERHLTVKCQTCHHNLTDRTGQLPCLTCHAGLPTTVAWSGEPLFHAFCLGCHRAEAALGRRHGVTALCSGCHKAP